MAAQKKERLVNLLPQEEFATSTLGRVLKWLLGTFRVIVISTEMIVMAGFLSRFYFDSKNSDLSDSINQKKAVIQSFAKVESDFRAAQDKLDIFSKMTAGGSKFLPVMQEITSKLPTDVQLTYLSLSDNILQIRGLTGSEQSASVLIANLQESKLFKDVGITQIESKQGESTLNFTLKATLKAGG